MHIEVKTGAPGSGKTTTELMSLVTNPGKYLFVTSRVDLITERCNDIATMQKIVGTSPLVMELHSRDGKGNGQGIASRVRHLPSLTTHSNHVIALITHEALMMTDFAGFSGWHIVIDEIPSTFGGDELHIPLSASILAENYTLEPFKKTGWYRAKPSKTAASRAHVCTDDLVQMVELDKKARSKSGILTDTSNFLDHANSDRPIKWYAHFDFTELDAFDSVTIIGAGFFHSLAYKIQEAANPGAVTYTTTDHSPSTSIRAQPRVEIHYFTRHLGSTTYWATNDGRDCIKAVADHLASIDIGYWSSNLAMQPIIFGAGVRGLYMKPRQEGSNHLIGETSVAFPYSSKALPFDRILTALFGITSDDICRARELEDIVQFTMRGAIRDPKFGGTYRIYLYEQSQAKFLADYLDGKGFTDVRTIAVTEAGIVDVQREPKKAGRPSMNRTAEEKKEASRLATAKNRLKKRMEQMRMNSDSDNRAAV